MEEQIFKNGSTTYYWSSKFFPKAVRADVFKLYSFVRVADDFVDVIPQQSQSFYELAAAYNSGQNSKDPVINQVVQNMREVSEKYEFDPMWTASFLQSMQWDLFKKNYKTLNDSLRYVYGSADVIGLMMAQILALPSDSYTAAAAQGRAMQWINFIRDLDEDNRLGRCYFPQSDLKRFGLSSIDKKSCTKKPEAFQAFIHLQLERYKKWQSEAEAGYKYIPKRLRVPVETASSMYNWTAAEIAKNPFVVFERKVKPSKQRVVASVVKSAV